MSTSTPGTKSAGETSQTFTILYFATASTYTNLTSENLPAPLALDRLFSTLESRYSGITAKVLKSCAVTVNLEYVDIEEDSPIKDVHVEAEDSENVSRVFMIQPGDEVGIIPPVSSG